MGSLFDTRNVLRVHFFLLFFFSAFTSASESTDKAASWLIGQQNSIGSIHKITDIAADFQSSTEAARSLRSLGKSEAPQFTALISYINSSGIDDSTENLARRISVNYRNGISVSSDVNQILDRRNDDGGFGAKDGYDSTVVDTAYALWGLGLANFSSSEITNEAVAFIVDEQLANGSWTNDARPHESIALTSQVLETLRLYSVRFNLQQTISQASSYLHSQKNAAGTWSNTENITDSLIALIPMSAEPSVYVDALSHLKASQLSNGSWDNDVYITARALYSIYLSENLPPPVVDNAANIAGQLIDQSTGAPISGVNINLSGTSTAAVSSDGIGQFSIEVAETGLYTLTFAINGFKARTIKIGINKLQPVNLGQIRLEPVIQVEPTIAVVHGVILDAVTQLPLEGVEISFSGAQIVNAVTDANGAYTASIANAGNSTVLIKKTGYQEIGASANIALGQRILFSPVLYPEGEEAPTAVGLKGAVLDSATGSAINNAKLTLNYAGSVVELEVANSGQFDFTDLSSGEVEILVSAPGYGEVSTKVYFVAGATLNLGEIRLEKRATSSVLHGVITNAVDGQSIAFASIKIVASPHVVTSESDGSYEIPNINLLEFTAEISAPGFETKAIQISAPEFQVIHLDVNLEPINNEDGFGIQSLSSEHPQYPAYKKAILFADFYNNDAQSVDLQMVLELKGDNGYYLRAPAAHLAFAGDDIADSSLHIPANTSTPRISFDWLTDTIPPGKYEVKLLAYDLESRQLLAEKATHLEILPTKFVSAVVGSVTPKFSYLNAEPTISFNVDITNQSNVPYELPIAYRWLSPDGVVINQGVEIVSLAPITYRQSVLLKSFTSKFTKSGDYSLEISIDRSLGIDIGSIVSPKVSVAPSVRIDPLIEVAPTVITPESDKKIKVTFKLKGIEENE